MSRLTPEERSAIAADVVTALNLRDEAKAIDSLRQVARLEDELRQAREQVARLTATNTFLQNSLNQLTSPNGVTLVPPAVPNGTFSPAPTAPFTTTIYSAPLGPPPVAS